MAGSAPVYQPPQVNQQDLIDQSTSEVSPLYDARIATQQSQIPAIQNEYKSLIDEIQNNQDQTQQGYARTNEANKGSIKLSNAAKGLQDSTDEQAGVRNSDYNYGTLSNNLINSSNIAKDKASAQNDQQVAAVRGLINELGAEKTNAILTGASQKRQNILDQYDKQYGHDYQSWADAIKQEMDKQMFDAQQSNHAEDLQMRKDELAYQQSKDSQAAYDKNNQLINSLVYDANGNLRHNNADDRQNSIYTYLMANGNTLTKAGYDVPALWQAWTQYHDQANGKPTYFGEGSLANGLDSGALGSAIGRPVAGQSKLQQLNGFVFGKGH